MGIFKEFLKGIIIGIANIIPGVSGGTMAVSMGVYDKIIMAITGFRKNFKTSVFTLIPYLLGAVAGIGALSFIVKGALSNYPLQTSGLFIGLIIGGLPVIISKVEGKKIGVYHIVVFLIFFALVTGMAFLNGNESDVLDMDVTPLKMVLLFFIGMIASATMIIPGVSGSLVLMILGYYSIIINNISTFIEALISLNMPGLIHGLQIFIPFGIGILLGIVLIAKLIEILFKKLPVVTYYGILGLIFGSPIAIIYKAGITTFSTLGIIATVVTFVVGFCVAFFLGRE